MTRRVTHYYGDDCPGGHRCDAPGGRYDGRKAPMAEESCSHGNVRAAGREWEHYEKRGPGCWHPVGGGQCFSWQALIDQAEAVAAARERALIVDYLRGHVGSASDIERGEHYMVGTGA